MWRERQPVRWERTVGRSVGDRPQAGGMAQRGFVGIRGGLPVARPIAHNKTISALKKEIARLRSPKTRRTRFKMFNEMIQTLL